MSIITKGLGIAKKFGKALKQDAPFYGSVGGGETGRHIYSKIKDRPTDIDVIKEIIKKVKDKKKEKKKDKK